MKIFMTKGTVVSQKPRVVGSTVSCETDEGKYIISLGRAIDASDKDAVAKAKSKNKK